MRNHLASKLLTITSRACRARAAANILADSSEISSIVTSEIAGAGLATDAEVSSAVSGLATSQDVTDAVSGLASSSDLTTAIGGVVTKLKQGAGLAMSLAIASYTGGTGGSGTEQVSSAMTVPSDITAQDEHQYEISGSFNVTDASNAQVASVRYDGMIVEYEGTGPELVLIKPGNVTLKTETGWTTFFSSAPGLPGWDLASGDFKMTVLPIDSQLVKVTGDFSMRELGQNHA